MIINLILKVILDFFTFIFSFLPIVTIADLPYIGETVSNGLYTMVTTWNGVVNTLPYLGIISNIFFWVIVPFELLMLTGKFFLGNRLPAHTN